jgi:hypothetical protein
MALGSLIFLIFLMIAPAGPFSAPRLKLNLINLIHPDRWRCFYLAVQNCLTIVCGMTDHSSPALTPIARHAAYGRTLARREPETRFFAGRQTVILTELP